MPSITHTPGQICGDRRGEAFRTCLGALLSLRVVSLVSQRCQVTERSSTSRRNGPRSSLPTATTASPNPASNKDAAATPARRASIVGVCPITKNLDPTTDTPPHPASPAPTRIALWTNSSRDHSCAITRSPATLPHPAAPPAVIGFQPTTGAVSPASRAATSPVAPRCHAQRPTVNT